MGFIGPVSSAVTISGAISTSSQVSTSTNVAPTTASGVCNGAATTDLRIVAAGKTLYLIGFTLSGGCNAAVATARHYVKDDTGKYYGSVEATGAATQVSTSAVSVIFPAGYYPTIAAGQKLQVQSADANGHCVATVYYVEL